MRTHHRAFLMLLILIVLPSLAFPIGNRANGETAQDCRTFDGAKELIRHLDSKSLQKNTESPLFAIEEGLGRISQLLATQGIPQGDVEIIKKHALELGFKPGYKVPNIEKIKEFVEKVFPIFEVTLNDLRNYAPGKDVSDLLSDTCQLLIPIEVESHKEVSSDNEVKASTSITIRFIPDAQGKEGQKEVQKENAVGWRLTRWGLPKLVRQLTDQRQQKQKTPGVKDFRLVSVPSLNRHYLGYKENNVVKLVPLFKNDHFIVGEPYLAQEVVGSLSKEANTMGNSPR